MRSKLSAPPREKRMGFDLWDYLMDYDWSWVEIIVFI